MTWVRRRRGSRGSSDGEGCCLVDWVAGVYNCEMCSELGWGRRARVVGAGVWVGAALGAALGTALGACSSSEDRETDASGGSGVPVGRGGAGGSGNAGSGATAGRAGVGGRSANAGSAGEAHSTSRAVVRETPVCSWRARPRVRTSGACVDVGGTLRAARQSRRSCFELERRWPLRRRPGNDPRTRRARVRRAPDFRPSFALA